MKLYVTQLFVYYEYQLTRSPMILSLRILRSTGFLVNMSSFVRWLNSLLVATCLFSRSKISWSVWSQILKIWKFQGYEILYIPVVNVDYFYKYFVFETTFVLQVLGLCRKTGTMKGNFSEIWFVGLLKQTCSRLDLW